MDSIVGLYERIDSNQGNIEKKLDVFKDSILKEVKSKIDSLSLSTSACKDKDGNSIWHFHQCLLDFGINDADPLYNDQS